MSYKIKPVKVGEFLQTEHSNFVYLHEPGYKFKSAILMWLIQGEDGEQVVVDTGLSDEKWALENHNYQIKRSEDMRPDNALKAHGVEVEDVSIVVNTHLHWDHCFNNDLFENARIYVQRREMSYAIAPLPEHAVFYESGLVGLTPPWLRTLQQFEIVDGEYEILPGVKLVPLPGHTPGLQGVRVETREGVYLIASDCLPIYKNWEGQAHLKHIPGGIHYNLEEYYKTLNKIEEITDFVLPGHDMKVLEREYYG